MKGYIPLLLALSAPILALPQSSELETREAGLIEDFFNKVNIGAACGKQHGGKECAKNGLFGSCCSSNGYCGSSAAHCLASNGCQSGCKEDRKVTPQNIQEVKQEPALGKNTQMKDDSVPVDAKIQSLATGASIKAAAAAPVTTDGTCGATKGGTVCGNWANGGCCSTYGWCGNTDGHCGAGCQSGPCTQAPAQTAPGAKAAPANVNPGKLTIDPSTTYGGQTVQAGVPAMHAGLMPNGRVFFLDKVENYTQVKLSNGRYAFSSEYDPVTKKVVPLSYKTNAFCSGGSYLPDGTVISVGGNADLNWLDPTVGNGFSGIRSLKRSATDASLNGQAWSEPANRKLTSPRWYATVSSMPDGRQFVASGSLNGLDPTVRGNNNPTWEMLSRTGFPTGSGSVNMTILEKNQPYYMYPFINLLRDGTMFVFVSKSAQIFKITGNTGAVVKNLPDLPGLYRTYPNTGGSVMLPLSSANNYKNEIIVCGGGAYQDITSPTEPSCGLIDPLAATPAWQMEAMPQGRGMVEGTIMADGTIVWVNGCNTGAQGFGLARNPTLQVLLYDPAKTIGNRFTTGPTSGIARLYHSVALLLLDGTVMIAGSNPVEMPMLKPRAGRTPSEDYVTEFRVETYTPPYLSGGNANKRPTAVTLSTKSLKPAQTFTVKFTAPANNKAVKVNLVHGGFVTHSVHMNQRSVFLNSSGFKAGATTQTITVTMPPNYNIVPPMQYVVYVLVDGVPAIGQFITVV